MNYLEEKDSTSNEHAVSDGQRPVRDRLPYFIRPPVIHART
jgi:hypothetical protein